jgi:Zn-dependent protease with chaperone function
MRNSRASGQHLVRLAVVLRVAGGLAVAAALGTAVESVHHVSMTAGHLTIFGLTFSYPSLNPAELLLLGLGVVGATAAMLAARTCWRQRVAYRGFLNELTVVGRVEGHPTVKVIADPRPQAFCAGYVRPAVYVSARALDVLSPDELEAVLAHEYHHKLMRDPLRIACSRIFARSLFFLPVLGPLAERYSELAELKADRAAIGTAGGEAALASALLAFDASAPSSVSGISPERVDSLLGQAARWRPPRWRMIVSVSGVLSFGLLVWRTAEVAAGQATFKPPFISSQPCLVVSLLLVLSICAAVGRRLTRIGPSAG